MRDYNFFTDYTKRKGINIDVKSPYFIGVLVLVIAIAICFGLIARNMMMDNQLALVNSDIEAIHVSADYINANKLKESIDAMAQYDQNAELALERFRDSSLIGTELLTALAMRLPYTVTMTTMTIDNNAANFTFTVPDRKTAAELLQSLKKTGLFQDVFLNSVTSISLGEQSTAIFSAVMKAGEAK